MFMQLTDMCCHLMAFTDAEMNISMYSDGVWIFGCCLTVAAVFQVGPDDVFLRETEDAQSPSSHGCVDCHTRVRHQLGSLIKPRPERNTPHFVSDTL